jgi:hypothetical protein
LQEPVDRNFIGCVQHRSGGAASPGDLETESQCREAFGIRRFSASPAMKGAAITGNPDENRPSVGWAGPAGRRILNPMEPYRVKEGGARFLGRRGLVARMPGLSATEEAEFQVASARAAGEMRRHLNEACRSAGYFGIDAGTGGLSTSARNPDGVVGSIMWGECLVSERPPPEGPPVG